MSVKDYKGFKPDWSCRDFQYAVDEIFEGNVVSPAVGVTHFLW